MLKEKWNTGLKKGLIISLSVLLMSSFVFSFGTNKVEAASYKAVSSTNYNVIVSAPINGPDSFIVSWSPKTDDSFVDYVSISIRWTDSAGPQTSFRLYLCGNDQITIPTHFSTMLDIYQVSISTVNSSPINQLGEIGSDVETIKNYLSSINQILSNGFTLNNYDLDLKQVAIYSYFAKQGGYVDTDGNDFLESDAMFFDYPIMFGYSNPNNADTNYLTAYADQEYIFAFALNTSTRMVQEDRMTLIYRTGGYSTFNITYRTQKSYGQTLHVSAFRGSSNKDGTNSNNSAFALQFAVNSLNGAQYIPLYWGPVQYCPDFVWELIQVPNPNLGEDEATNTISNLDDANDEFNSQVSEIDDIQNDLEDDFQTNIQAIDTDLDFESSFGQKFVTSAHWVRTQFETLTTQTPYGSILFFALTLGLALMIIGRVI